MWLDWQYQIEYFFQVMRFRVALTRFYQTRFQVFLSALLTMKTNDAWQRRFSLAIQMLRGRVILFRFCYPFRGEGSHKELFPFPGFPR